MRPAPPGPRERGAHPAVRGRRARPALAPGRRPQRREAFSTRPAAAEPRTALPALPNLHAAVTRAGERSPEAELQPEDTSSPYLLPAASTPWQKPTRSRDGGCGDPDERGQGLPRLQGRRQPEKERGAQMTGRSCQRGGGRLRVFVLGEEAERPITQFVYSTQTQFVTGWLCLEGGMLTWSNLRSQLGDIDVAGILRSNNPHACACNSHRTFFPS